jgi:hypothetical protein
MLMEKLMLGIGRMTRSTGKFMFADGEVYEGIW